MNLDFSKLKVLLVGDFMLDEYVIGDSFRKSPEAPVPVVTPKNSIFSPGGAGNVAMNLSSLSVKAHCVGNVGNDVYGKKIISLLKNNGHNIDRIEIIKNHITTLKKRIILNSEQIVRLDYEKKFNWKPNFDKISLDKFDVCIYSDYNKGVVSNIENNDIITIVDPKKEDFSVYKFANIITPNLNELYKATNCDINDDQSILLSCQKLIADNGFDFILAKKGNRGMSLIGKDNFEYNIKALKVDNPDVTGAGDTVIAAFSMAYVNFEDIRLALDFANIAAGLVVNKTGTSTVSIKEIKKFI